MFMRFILFIGISFLLGCQQFGTNLGLDKTSDTAQKSPPAGRIIEEPEEIMMGGGIAANLLGASPLLADNRVQQYVNQVGRWVSLHTERPDLSWKFGILASTDVNAFAVPGGTIFITRGLLQKLDNESELAGVLAHEMAHVLRKHHLAALQKGKRLGPASNSISEALQDKDNWTLEKAIKAGTEVYTQGLDKQDEFEADRMGIVIATRAGYDPYGLPAVLLALEAGNAQHSSLALMSKTHPAPRERLKLLDKIMGNFFEGYTAPAQAEKRFGREVLQRM